MEKIKKSIFGLIVAIFSFVTLLNVNALTIKETVTSDDKYNTISDGTIVMGITKFESNVVLTARRVSDATYNDLMFNTNNNPVEIYYLLSGDWYNIDEDNKAILVEEQTKIEELNDQNIYYVNNEEKMLEMPFPNILADGYEFVFCTNDAKKNTKVKVENKKIFIPATVKSLEVSVKNVDKETTSKLDSFELNADNLVFSQKSALGTIQKGDNSGGALTYSVSGNVITITGELIKWYNNDFDLQNGRDAGNYASVKITAPEIYTDQELLDNTQVLLGTRPFDWEGVNKYETGNDYFVFYPRFDEDTKEQTVTVTWVDGNKQVFTIVLDEDIEIEQAPQGTIVKGGSSGGALDYDTVGNTITITGESIKWYPHAGTLQNGRDAGNYAAVKINAPEGYTKEYLEAKATVKIDEREVKNWGEIIYGAEDVYFVYYPRFDEDTKKHTVTIEWEKGSTQVFTIVLDEKVAVEQAPQGTIEKGGSSGGDLSYNTVGNITTITGASIKWYPYAGTLQNGRDAGNYAAVKINAPEGYTKEYLEEKATVKIDERGVKSWGEIIYGAEDVYFVYYPRFDKDTKEHTVTVEWEPGSTQVFTIVLNESVVIEQAPQGTISSSNEYYEVDGDTITINGALEWADEAEIQNGRLKGYYSAGIKFTAPQDADKEFSGQKTSVYIDERDHMEWDYVTSFEAEGADYFIYWPKFDEEITEHTVAIEWEPGNTQIFKIKLGNVTFEGKPVEENEG